MFLRHTKRKKDGKEHRYWSIVENRRIGGGRVVQRPLLYLGEINDSQELAWRKSIAILEEGALHPRTLSLFAEDGCEGLLPDASIVRLRLNELRLCRPRQWGGCWLALSLWRELELDRFWGGRLPPSRKSLPLRRQGARGGTGCCCCWRATGCWRRAASGGCIANGLSAVPWPICSAKTSGWPKSTSCIAVTTGGSNTSRPCSIIWSGASGRALARPVQHQLRWAALRSDQHLFRGRSAVCRKRQATPRLFARSPAGLRAGRHRLGGDPGGVAAGLRGAAWQHRGQHHLARLPGTDRAAVRQGEAHLVDGPRNPDRGGAGRDAGGRSPGPIPRRHAQGPPDPIGEGPPREALAAGPAGGSGQALAARRRTLCFRRQSQPRRQGAGNAAATAEMVVGAPQAALNDGAQPRGIADEARRCPSPCPSRVAPGRHRGSA